MKVKVKEDMNPEDFLSETGGIVHMDKIEVQLKE